MISLFSLVFHPGGNWKGYRLTSAVNKADQPPASRKSSAHFQFQLLFNFYPATWSEAQCLSAPERYFSWCALHRRWSVRAFCLAPWMPKNTQNSVSTLCPNIYHGLSKQCTPLEHRHTNLLTNTLFFSKSEHWPYGQPVWFTTVSSITHHTDPCSWKGDCSRNYVNIYLMDSNFIF